MCTAEEVAQHRALRSESQGWLTPKEAPHRRHQEGGRRHGPIPKAGGHPQGTPAAPPS